MNKIFWHQGLFLQPQHLELLEKRLEEKVNNNFLYNWGVKSIDINEDELKNNSINIDKMEIILKNGDYISLDNSIVFNKLLNDEKGSSLVYIGIKKFQKFQNVEVSNNLSDIKGDKRFICDINGMEIKDLYDGEESATIEFLKYSVKIFLEKEIKSIGNYELIPITKINFDERKIEKYIPPLLNVSDNYLMKKQIDSIYNLLIDKIAKLEEYKLPFSSNYSSNKYLKFLNILQILNKTASKFYIINEHNQAHPLEVYNLLRELIAEISTFSDRINFYGKAKNGNNLLQNYKHSDILSVLSSFEYLMKELLDEIVIGPEYSISLIEENGVFSVSLDNRIFEKNYSYYLILHPKNSEFSVDDFIKFAKISSKERIILLVQRALQGLKVENIKALEGMPIRDDVFYFKLDTFDKEWQNIVKSKTLGVFYKDIEFVELIVMKE